MTCVLFQRKSIGSKISEADWTHVELEKKEKWRNYLKIYNLSKMNIILSRRINIMTCKVEIVLR